MPRPLPPALNVRWPDGRLVGKVITPGPTHFGYAPDWLANGSNLSPLAVPFTDVLFRQRVQGFDHLPGFLADCLPDQWGRRLMEREFREKDLTPTPMRMLAWVGRRGLGALQFEPAFDDEHSTSSWEEVKPILLTREVQAVMRNAPASSFRHLMGAGTAGGALPKATVVLLRDGTILSGGIVADRFRLAGRLGLLKLDSEDDPLGLSTDGRFEHAYLKMAQAAGIRTVKSKILPETSGSRPRHHLFVERFDVRPKAGHRLHVLTLAGALHRHDLTYGDLLQTVRTLTADHEEVLEAVRRMCFNVRAGNADDHGKNHSFLFDDTVGRWTLSPAYDLTLNYSAEGNARGLFPRSFGASPRRQLLVDTAADAGVSADEFDRIDADVAQALSRWPEHAERVELPMELVNKARTVQQGLAVSLTVETAVRSKRRRRW